MCLRLVRKLAKQLAIMRLAQCEQVALSFARFCSYGNGEKAGQRALSHLGGMERDVAFGGYFVSIWHADLQMYQGEGYL